MPGTSQAILFGRVMLTPQFRRHGGKDAPWCTLLKGSDVPVSDPWVTVHGSNQEDFIDW